MPDEWEPRKFDFRDEKGLGYEVSVRRDGCADMWRYLPPHGGNDERCDYLHICELPEFIEMLTGIESQTREWRIE